MICCTLRKKIFCQYSNILVYQSQVLRYGENPHQRAAFYTDSNLEEVSIANSKQIQGKPLNNINDTDAAVELVAEFDPANGPACVIVKHANPCGVAEAGSLSLAYDLAFATDPTSAFGGILAFNRMVDADLARTIVERQFVEVIIAPEISC